MKFSKKDLVYSIITGFTTGFIAWQIFDFLRVPEFHGVSFVWFVVIVPVAWIIGVNLGYFLGRWFNFFNQFGRFAAIGFTNAAVDFGILNLLIAWTGIVAGIYYSVFKATSFAIATLHSYFWNKYWTFEAGDSKNQSSEATGFFTVTIIAALINIAFASLLVNFVHPVFGLNAKVWANVAAIISSAFSLIFSFVGFRVVFRKNK